MNSTYSFHNETLKFTFWKEPPNVFLATEIISLLAKKLNFSPEFDYIDYRDLHTFPNNTPFNKLLNGSTNGTCSYCRNFTPDYDVGDPYITSEIVAVMKPRKAFTLQDAFLSSTSKKFKTFIFLIMVVAAGLLRISMVIRKIKDDFSLPALVSIGLTYGLTVKIPPKMSSWLSKAIIFTIILITLHVQTFRQAVIFKSRLVDINHEDPKTIQDLGNEYQIQVPDLGVNKMLYENLQKAFAGNLYGIVFSNLSTLELLARLKTDPDNYGVLLDIYNVVDFIKMGIIDKDVHIVEGSVISIHRCFFFQANSSITPAYDLYSDLIFESGIMSRLLKSHETNKNRRPISKTLREISLNEFMFALELWSNCICCCFLGFFGEIGWSRLRNRFRMLRRLC